MSLLLGRVAPRFKAKAIVSGTDISELSLESFLGKYVVLFFYPLDFTFVCPTELHSFQKELPAFLKKNTQLIGCSVDSIYSHYAWIKTPKDKGGIEGVTYPIVSDLDKSIATRYGVLKEDEGVAYRALFILDRAGIVRHQLVNDLPIGRSVDEVLRILDAIVSYETCGEVCPANWRAGQKTIKPDQAGLEDYFSVK